MNQLEIYKKEFLNFLKNEIPNKEPKKLYEPIEYILDLGGKRIRPILTLWIADLYQKSFKKALPAASAVEVFHNFTLIHDDIMDSAPIRRGKPTVHNKWDENAGILSGDAMMILAYQFLNSYSEKQFKQLTLLLSKTAIEVCEGQQMDMDFETAKEVSIAQYLKMISLKTSVLIGAAMKMGAIVADVSEKEATKIYKFGLNLGIAFQLQDDYLDTFGEELTFGKAIGGDINENKKTFLFLKTLEVANKKDAQLLDKMYLENTSTVDKVNKVKALFKQYKIDEITQFEIKKYTHKAFEILNELSLSNDDKINLKEFGLSLMSRTF
ncbi:MAG: polyprenyl synthetase family protein [Lutibacter sp.]